MKHWTQNEFEQWLYGLKEEDGHVAECAECRVEMERLTLERRRMVTPPEVSHDFLAAQRRGIHQRLGDPIRNWAPLRWAASVMTLLLVVFSLTLRSSKTTPAISDEQLFSELAAMEQSAEPKAIAPIHKLFEE
jgi:hypothetical protein